MSIDLRRKVLDIDPIGGVGCKRRYTNMQSLLAFNSPEVEETSAEAIAKAATTRGIRAQGRANR